MNNEISKLEQYSIEKAQSLIDMSIQLKKFIADNELSVRIKGKPYVMVEGWQFLGGCLGIVSIVESCERVSDDEVKYKACAHLVRLDNGMMIGRGEAYCSKSEDKKKSFEEYAIASTAQTRAVAKAYRNVFGWMMKAAGFEATPAEEMEEGSSNKKPDFKFEGATNPQIELIKKLTKSHVFKDDSDVASLLQMIEKRTLSKDRASGAIEWLNSEIETRKKLEKEAEQYEKEGKS